MIYRNLTPVLQHCKKSVLLLGPRQVGKSTLIGLLKPELSINLADLNQFFNFTSNPNELRTQIETNKPKVIFIDEIQKYPPLLNTIQALIDEKKGLKFYLTGSSARKLKRGQANLLPGRILNYYLGPLVSSELYYEASQDSLLRFGSLPEIYLEESLKIKRDLLKTYLLNYIHEEIRAEALVRNIDSFSRALPYAINTSGKFIDYSKLAKQSKVSRHALSRFYEILEDTLIGQRLWPDEKLKEKADLIKHPKFFVFDLGIYNATAGSFDISEDRKGILFEHLVYNQIFHSGYAKDKDLHLNTFRSRGGLEVDLILTLEGKRYAIEIKSSEDIEDQSVSSLLRLKTEYENSISCYVAYMGKKSKKISGVWCHHWQVLLKELGL